MKKFITAYLVVYDEKGETIHSTKVKAAACYDSEREDVVEVQLTRSYKHKKKTAGISVLIPFDELEKNMLDYRIRHHGEER